MDPVQLPFQNQGYRVSPSLGQETPVTHPWSRQPHPPHTRLERGSLHVDGGHKSLGISVDPLQIPICTYDRTHVQSMCVSDRQNFLFLIILLPVEQCLDHHGRQVKNTEFKHKSL